MTFHSYWLRMESFFMLVGGLGVVAFENCFRACFEQTEWLIVVFEKPKLMII